MALFPYKSRKDRLKTVLIAGFFLAIYPVMLAAQWAYDPQGFWQSLEESQNFYLLALIVCAVVGGVAYVLRNPKEGGQ